ncbi:hypothetical protein [Legionella drozanskii]|uniref:hypothetical protein n=1 Tax=Legionella drozanskii TaxID=96228 RepID=UPI0010416713|nr:hypothetical protein [Legionella drozanskii]
MNLKLGTKMSHYGLMILAALLGLAIALRQIFAYFTRRFRLWLAPSGFSLYSWSAISFGIIIAIAAIAFLFEQGFTEESPTLAIGFIFL